MDSIGKRLKDAREFADLSQTMAAKLLDMRRDAINQVEADKRQVTAE